MSMTESSLLQIAQDFTLPLETVTQTFAILAKRGAGKTYTSSVMAEEMLKAGLPVVIIDPLGAWWGLRASADGETAGLPIAVLGGEHGDVQITEDMGAQIAALIAENNFSTVIDLSLFRKAAQARFMTAFAETLYHKNRLPLHLIVDEADLYAPQRPIKGQERMLGAMEDIVRRGRFRGLGVTMITQRSAVLNKDVLTQIETLIVLRTISPQDRGAMDEWIKIHGTAEQREQFMQSLPSLPIGTCWLWSPGWLDEFRQIHIRRRETFDSSATPKMGEGIVAPRVQASVDLNWLADALKVKTKEQEASDIDGLKQEIRQLQAELKRKPEKEVVEVPVLNEDEISRLTDLAGELGILAREIIEAVGRAQTPMRQSSPVLHSIPTRPPLPVAPTQPASNGNDAIKLKAGERRILEMLARRYPTILTRTQVGTLSGFTTSGGTFGNYFGTLKRNNFLVEENGGVLITAEGFDYLGLVEPPVPQTQEEVVDMWASALKAGERKMLDVLLGHYPDWMTREELGEASGFTYTGGTFGNYLGVLRRNGLAETEGSMVRAGDALFI